METITLWLRGKKTFIVGIGAVVAVVVAWSVGEMEAQQAIEAIVAALMGMFIRAGVTNEAKKVKE